MFHAIGNFCYRFRWIVIALWIVVFGVSVAATPLPRRHSHGRLHRSPRSISAVGGAHPGDLQPGRDQPARRLPERHAPGRERGVQGRGAAGSGRIDRCEHPEPGEHPDLREHGQRSARLQGRHELRRRPQLLGALADGAEADAGHQGRACGQRAQDLRDRRARRSTRSSPTSPSGTCARWKSTVCRWRSSPSSSSSAAWCRRRCRSSPAAWR